MALPGAEVPMLVPEIVRQIRALAGMGWGAKRIAAETGVARGTVRRYARGGADSEVQRRPAACTLDEAERRLAVELLDGPAQGNGVVMRRLLGERGVPVPLRTLQRALMPHRQARRAAEVATVRFETAPGDQMQIDFGEKQVVVGGVLVRVHLFVGVLGYSRRLFTRASLSQRQDDWREGLAGAFRHFGGVPRALLLDNAGALVVGRDRAADKARLHPAFEAFCRDWSVEARVCRPYRARTKGKTEGGVGYVKRNALAGIAFASFAELEAHLCRWMVEADDRVHGTTHERATRPFRVRRAHGAASAAGESATGTATARLPPRRYRLLRRCRHHPLQRPHGLVRRSVEVLVGDDDVTVFDGATVVARHRRSHEPHDRIVDATHFEGLWRRPEEVVTLVPSLSPGRSLADYADAIGGGS